ncbi:MAG: hypothetical protein ACRD6X_03755 [Pyrinomonadaceae bacterium]
MNAAASHSDILELVEVPRKSESKTETPTDIERSMDALYFELGLWIRSLENLCSMGRSAYSGLRAEAADADPSIELSIYRSILLHCCELSQMLGAEMLSGKAPYDESLEEIERFSADALALNNAISRAAELGISEVSAWSAMLALQLRRTAIYTRFDIEFERYGEEALPSAIHHLLSKLEPDSEDMRDLKRFLPRFGGLLRCLSMVGAMIDRDAAMRPALAIFAFIYETVNNLVADINTRLAARSDENSEIFGLMDAASYTLSIETKRVFSHELSAIRGVQTSTTVLARIEAAYGVLNDNLRQVLTGFAQHANPQMAAAEVFPEFRIKLERSIDLRSRLSAILESLRKIEPAPDQKGMQTLNGDLAAFLNEPVSCLFYKDRETFERFCGELQITKDLKDAGPILHRFLAYVETLFGQVQLRAVLANHPPSK